MESPQSRISTTTGPAPVVVLFGAPPDTGNLGVSALCHASVQGVLDRVPGAALRVFDHGRGLRRGALDIGPASPVVDLCGAANTRRLHRPESLAMMYATAVLRAPRLTNARWIADADAVLDISGGDSFTDLYGSHRFWTVALPKLTTLRLGRPLALLPQTYGPFNEPETRRRASTIVRRATMAWARDARSFEILRDLLGDSFDPTRHCLGVDVAFGLRTQQPSGAVVEGLPLEPSGRAGRPLIGFNVSGLIWNDPEKARSRYRFKADYRAAVVGFLTRLLEREDVELLLVPHVLAPTGHFESDGDACAAARDALPPGLRARAHVLRGVDTAPQAKWVIARCHWFCGTRMHATIAGLSSGVPTASISYSDKTLGVFETCSVGDAVIDPREHETADVVERLWDVWKDRERHRNVLSREAPGMARRAADQMDRIVAACLAVPLER